jgi:hypothetical protein
VADIILMPRMLFRGRGDFAVERFMPFVKDSSVFLAKGFMFILEELIGGIFNELS